MSDIERLVEQAGAVEGVFEAPSQFGHRRAFWVDGREVAHVEDGGVFEVRLTRGAIRTQRDALEHHPSVRLRGGTSDWLEVVVNDSADVEFALRLFEQAVAAHRPEGGGPGRPPPSEPDLKRRRRLH